MLQIYFLTSNNGKLKSMRKWVEPLGIRVYIKRPSAKQPERKEESLERVAEFKIRDHTAIIDAPFVVQDGGFFLDAVPGFPGPDVNHVLSTIGIEGILKMVPEDRRTCCFRDVLAFWSPTLQMVDPKNPVRFFKSELRGEVALTPSENRTDESWSALWRIFVPAGCQQTLAAMDGIERARFLERLDSPETNCFVAFAEWLKANVHLLYVQRSLFDQEGPPKASRSW